MIRWPRPERALVAGKVLSFHEPAETVLPRGVVIGAGRILALFDPDDRAARRDLGVAVEDLGDTVLMPGFIDAHNHLPSAVLDSFAVPTAHVLSGDDLVAALAAAVDGLPADQWVATEHALSLHQFPVGDPPTAEVLDRVPGDNPIAVRLGAHAMVLNGRAMALAGIADHRGDPPGGMIERDPTGRPTGIIREYGAIGLVLRCFDPRAVAGDLSDAIRATQRDYARTGITTVRVTGFREGELAAFQGVLAADGRLATRVFGGPRLDPTATLVDRLATIESWPAATGFGGEWLAHDAVKIFVDHGIETIVDGGEPTLLMEREELLALVARAAGLGWAVTCHAATRLGVDAVLDVFERVRRTSTTRLSIEHGFDVSDAQLTRMAAHDIWWSTQPAVVGVELNAAATALRRHRLVPLRTALRLGVGCVLGSDWNGTPGRRGRPFQPLESVALSVERRSLWGQDFDVEESLPASAALHLHTRTAALMLGRGDLGVIAPGASADLVGLDADPTATLRPGVRLTLVGGRAV